MKAPRFDYVRVRSIEEAIAQLQQHGEGARVLAGGQTLLATPNLRLSEPQMLVDIGGIAALRGIERRGEQLWIGALATHAEIESSALVAEHAPLLAAAAPHIAHRAIRNVGTWGGSLAYADPAAEWPACLVTLEGTRPLLLEVQALVSPTDLAMPRRVGTGVDPKRLAMIVAVLARHAGLPLGGADVFVNVAGGVRIDEPGGDLGIALAIASAARGSPVRDGIAAFGEIGLTGRLRAATQADRRVEECRKLGLTTVLAPPATDAAHPAFSKLFVESELLRERQAIVCTRRPRAPDEPTLWMFDPSSASQQRAGWAASYHGAA